MWLKAKLLSPQISLTPVLFNDILLHIVIQHVTGQ